MSSASDSGSASGSDSASDDTGSCSAGPHGLPSTGASVASSSTRPTVAGARAWATVSSSTSGSAASPKGRTGSARPGNAARDNKGGDLGPGSAERLYHLRCCSLRKVGIILLAVYAVILVAVTVLFTIVAGVFGIVVVAMAAVILLWIYRRLIYQPLDLASRPWYALVISHVAMAVISFLSLAALGMRNTTTVTVAVLAILSGFAFVLFGALVLCDLATLVWWLVNKARKVASPTEDIRFLQGRAIVALTIAIAISTYGVVSAYKDPALEEVEVTLSRLPAALDGFTIGVVSDIHLGATIGAGLVNYTVATLNEQDIDMVAIVGDMADATVADMGFAANAFGDLKVPAFFVTGNHDYYLNEDREWVAHLASLGIRSLRNEMVSFPPNSTDSFDLAGVDDWAEGEHNITAAVAGRDPSRELILLAHQPLQVHEAGDVGVGLMLSGHVHCGQIIPAHMVSYITNPYFAGLSSHSDLTQIYVTCGTGFWLIPMRTFARSEITLVTLRSEQAL